MSILWKSERNSYKPYIMRPLALVAALLLITSANSCTTYYYITTYVSGDASVERRVHLASSDGESVEFPFDRLSDWTVSQLDKPFIVDFYDTAEKMTHVAVRNGWNIASVCMQKPGRKNPLFCPYESLDSRFRWFYTYYDYSALFAGLDEMLPLPFDGYLTDDQLRLFFRGEDPPGGWNGLEMYYLLDDITRNFVSWHSDATYHVLSGIFGPYCNDDQVAVLYSVKDRFMDGVESEALFAMKPDEFEDRLASVAPEAGFGKIYEANQEEIDSAYDREMQIMDCFDASFRFVLKMPGRYIGGNAADFVDGDPAWKVDAYRLMYGDLALEATTRKVNVWAFMLTFAAIVLLLQIFAKVYAKY